MTRRAMADKRMTRLRRFVGRRRIRAHIRRNRRWEERLARAIAKPPADEGEALVQGWIQARARFNERRDQGMFAYVALSQAEEWVEQTHSEVDAIFDEDSGEVVDATPRWSSADRESAGRDLVERRKEALEADKELEDARQKMVEAGRKVGEHRIKSFWTSLNQYSLAVGGLALAVLGLAMQRDNLPNEQVIIRWTVGGLVAGAFYHAPPLMGEGRDWIFYAAGGNFGKQQFGMRSWIRWMQLAVFIGQVIAFGAVLTLLFPSF